MASLEDFINCSICFEHMQEPKRLHCPHSYCAKCLTRLEESGRISCPECRLVTNLPDGGVNGLPTDVRIVGLIDLHQTDRAASGSGLCQHCDKDTCTACAKKHKYGSVVIELQLIRDKISSQASKDRLSERKKDCERIQENFRSTRNEINEAVDKLVAEMEEGRTRLLSLVEEREKVVDEQMSVIGDLVAAEEFSSEAWNRLVERGEEENKSLLDECSRLNALLDAMDETFSVPLPAPVKFHCDGVSIMQSFRKHVVVSNGYKECKRVQTAVQDAARGNDFTDVAVHPGTGDLFAASANHVFIYHPDGTFVRKFWTGADWPRIAVDSNGRVIVSCQTQHCVTVYTEHGELVERFGSHGLGNGQFVSPLGVTTDTENNIYICDFSNSRIQIFDSHCRYLRTVGKGVLTNPNYVAVDSRKQIYVTALNNSKVFVFSSGGELMTSFDGGDDSKLQNPRGIHVDSYGFIFVSNVGKTRVDIFTPDRHYYCSLSDAGNPFQSVRGLASTHDGRVAVVDYEAKKILIF